MLQDHPGHAQGPLPRITMLAFLWSCGLALNPEALAARPDRSPWIRDRCRASPRVVISSLGVPLPRATRLSSSPAARWLGFSSALASFLLPFRAGRGVIRGLRCAWLLDGQGSRRSLGDSLRLGQTPVGGKLRGGQNFLLWTDTSWVLGRTIRNCCATTVLSSAGRAGGLAALVLALVVTPARFFFF